jgi:hypothetical protein
MLSRPLDPGRMEEAALVLPAPLGARKKPVLMRVLHIAGS